MNKQHYKNGDHKFPVSTEALEFIQQQIFLVARLCSLAGTNVIVKQPVTTANPPSSWSYDDQYDPYAGLVIIAGKLYPLYGDSSQNGINIVEASDSVRVDTSTMTVRTYRYAQYATGGTHLTSSFSSLDNIVTLMSRISTLEGTCMTETDIRALVQTVQTNLNTTDGNLSSLTTRVQTIENNYKTAAQITELLNANAQHHLPKGSIIDWYGTADCDHIPYGYVPCGIFFRGSASQFAPDGAGTKELAKWRAKYSGINIGSAAIGSYVDIRIADYNGQTVPDLTDRFIVQAGGSHILGTSGGNTDGKVTMTEANMPRHKHDVAVNNTGSDHQHRIAWPANAGGDARIDAENYINQGGQGAKGNETYILTHATATNYNGKHTHTVSESYKGSGTAFSIMPPYYALYKLIKVI